MGYFVGSLAFFVRRASWFIGREGMCEFETSFVLSIE